MPSFSKQIILGVLLLLLSAVAYSIHYFIFRDAHHIFIYMIGDIAFVFIEVLLVTIIIHQVLEDRDIAIRLYRTILIWKSFGFF